MKSTMQTSIEISKASAVKPPNVTEAELRRELRQAIEARAEADSRAHDAKQVADKAGHETRLSINHASE